jgi:hypothetical protein
MFDKIKDVVSDITGGGDLGDLSLGGYEKYLEGITWPVSKDELINAVQQNGASDKVVDQVRNLGGDKFDGPADIIKGLIGDGGDSAKAAGDTVTQDVSDNLKNLKKPQ